MLSERHTSQICQMLARHPLAILRRVLPMVPEDGYMIVFEDRRDGREHLISDPRDALAWLVSIRRGRCWSPRERVCPVCERSHGDRGLADDLFLTCIPCQAESLILRIRLARE